MVKVNVKVGCTKCGRYYEMNAEVKTVDLFLGCQLKTDKKFNMDDICICKKTKPKKKGRK